MSQSAMVTLAKLIASEVNNLVNIPFLNEEDEQRLFELLILKALELFFVLNKGSKAKDESK